MPPLPAGEHMQCAVRDSSLGVMRCAVVSPCSERLEGIRLAAEREAWEAIVCKDASAMLRCVFRETLPLSIVDMPPAAGDEYEDYRAIAERLSEIGGSNMLLVVCADTESVQEEIWARQLGIWSYLPLANLSPKNLTLRSPNGAQAHDGADTGSKMQSDKQGLALVFGTARKALERIALANANAPGQWDRRAAENLHSIGFSEIETEKNEKAG